MGGALHKKGGSLLSNDGRMAGDPHVGSARARRRLVSKGVEKALAKHPCGPCSVCCTTMAVEAIGKPEGEPCEYMRAAPNTGPLAGKCSIYKTRPEPCAGYNCLYRVGLLDEVASLAGNAGRPDALGILFDVNDTRATGIQMVIAREVRTGALEEHMPILHELAARGHVLYLVDGDRRRMMGPEERVRAVQLAAKRTLPIVSR